MLCFFRKLLGPVRRVRGCVWAMVRHPKHELELRAEAVRARPTEEGEQREEEPSDGGGAAALSTGAEALETPALAAIASAAPISATRAAPA